MIILNDTLGAVGGSHTLFLRMCAWYRKQGMKVSFFCNNRDNEEIASQLEVLGVTIYVIDTGGTKETYRLLKRIDDGDLRVVNFWWNMYLNIEAVKYRYKIKIDNVIYLIHPKCLIKGDSYKKTSGFVKAITNGYMRIIPRMCENNAIISMDDINIKETENYYKIDMKPVPPIIRLPMDIEVIDKESVIREGFSSRLIMTSCRADFPYKGYVIGLVDVFAALKEKYSDLKLQIVCDGSDVNVLKDKIASVSEGVRKDIEWHGWMSYEALKEKMNDCMIYIGMGSSVLDASLRYKPSAVIQFYTMDCIGRYYTAENPYDLAAKDGIHESASNMLDRVLRMSFEEYKALSEKTFDRIAGMYGTDSVMRQFVGHRTCRDESILDARDNALIWANNQINAIRFHNKKEKSSVQHLSGN